jgi:PAS domain S-box-containing protein
MEPWWEEAVRRGYCSSAVFPLFSNSRTLGSLNLYAGTPGFFNDVTVDLLESLAWEISFAIESFEHQKERDLAIEALRENEERYHGFYEHSPLEYQSLDENGCLITVNSAWLELMGYEPEEVVGRWFGEFLTPEDVERFKRKFREFTAEGKVHTRFEMIRKDRTRRCVWLDGQVWYDDDGFVKQANCILHEETGPESRAG